MGLILSGAWIYALKCVDIKIIFEIAICIRISPCCRHYVILPWANLANYMIYWSFPCLNLLSCCHFCRNGLYKNRGCIITDTPSLWFHASF